MAGFQHALTMRSKGQRSNPNPNPREFTFACVGLHVDTTAHFSNLIQDHIIYLRQWCWRAHDRYSLACHIFPDRWSGVGVWAPKI